MIIIPKSRKMTFQSTPVCSSKKAVSASTRPMTTMPATPPRAAATRWTRSVAMRAYATMKTARGGGGQDHAIRLGTPKARAERAGSSVSSAQLASRP